MTARAFRLWYRVAAGVGVLAAVLAPPAAAAQYVKYYHAFGQWAVICAMDEPTGRTSCEMRAPPPSLGSADESVRVNIVEPPAGEAAVTVHINRVVDAGRGISLAVDGKPPHETALSRVGEAGWRGAEAGAILAEMAKGRVLTVRFVRWGDNAFTVRRLSLQGFAAARQTYRQRSAGVARR